MVVCLPVVMVLCSGNNSIPVDSNAESYSELKKQIKENSGTYSEYCEKLDDLNKQMGIQNNYSMNNLNDKGVPAKTVSSGNQNVQPTGLSKQTASNGQTMQLIGVKEAACQIERPFIYSFDVPANATLSVSLSGTISGVEVDPFLVIYKVNNGNPFVDYKLQQQLTVLAYNDDSNGLYPAATWINQSANAQTVYVLAFAYDPYSKGDANVNIFINGGLYYANTISIVAQAMFYDNTSLNGAGNYMAVPSSWQNAAPGQMAFGSTSAFQVDGYSFGQKAPFANGDTYIWAFNFSEMKGIANDDYTDGSTASGATTFGWMTFPTGSHYPNVVLFGGYSSYGNAQFLETVLYYDVQN
jgi:hypothetical protein